MDDNWRSIVKADTDVAKWYHFDQNNSGGFFYRNDDVDEDVFIQARSAEEAGEKLLEITAGYSDFCECCGERWYSYTYREGQDLPSRYGSDTPFVEDAIYYTYSGDKYALRNHQFTKL